MAKEFELEFYKLHRAHEVALNAATATYEQSILRLILVLNGAAIASLLTLVQTVGACSFIKYDFGQAKAAIFWWVGGVGVSFLATFFAYWSQRKFTQAYRSRRTAIEAEAMSTDEEWDRYGVVKVGGEDKEAAARRYRKSANDQRSGASNLQKRAIVLGALAVVCSITGFAFAATSIKANPQAIQPSMCAATKAG